MGRAAKKKSEEDIKSIKKPQDLGHDYHPFHAVYISTQNLVSVLAENLTAFDELVELSRKGESTGYLCTWLSALEFGYTIFM